MAEQQPGRRRGRRKQLHDVSDFGSDGHILSKDEREEQRRRAGLCHKCGMVETHERPKGIFNRFNLRPITNSDVYKGYHLNCYGGLCGVKEILAEPVTDEDREYDRRRSNPAGLKNTADKAKHKNRLKLRKGKAKPAEAPKDPPDGETLQFSGHAEVGHHAQGLHSGMLLPDGHGSGGHGGHPRHAPHAHHLLQHHGGNHHPPLTEIDPTMGPQRFESLSTLGAPSEYLDSALQTPPPIGEQLSPDQQRLAMQVDAVNQYQERMALMRIGPIGEEKDADGREGGEAEESGGGHLRSGSLTLNSGDVPPPYAASGLESPSTPGGGSFSDASSPQRKSSSSRMGSLKNKIKARLKIPSITDSVGNDLLSNSERSHVRNEEESNTSDDAVSKSSSDSLHQRHSQSQQNHHAGQAPGGASASMDDLPEMTTVPTPLPPVDMTPSSTSLKGSSFALSDLEFAEEEGVRRVVEAAREKDYQAVLTCVKTHRTSAAVARAACRTVRVSLVSIAKAEHGTDGGDPGDAARSRKESDKDEKGGDKDGKKKSLDGKKKSLDEKKKSSDEKKKSLGRPSADSSLSRGASVSTMRHLPGTWVKVLAHTASVDHQTDPTVNGEVIRTMWTLAAMADRHKSDVKDCGGLDMAIAAMGRFSDDNEVQMYGAGLIGCLAGSDRHGSTVRGARGAVESLIKAVNYKGKGSSQDDAESAAVAECALHALFQLVLFAVRQQGAEGGRAIATEVANAGGTSAIVDAMCGHEASSGVQTHACRVLWALSSVPKEGSLSPPSSHDDDTDREEEKREIGEGDETHGYGTSVVAKDFVSIVDVSRELADAMKQAVERHSTDITVVTAVLGLLTSLSCCRTAAVTISSSTDIARCVAGATMKAVIAHPGSSGVLQSSCMVICNLCDVTHEVKNDEGADASGTPPAKEIRSVFSLLGGVEVLVKVLRNHPGDELLLLQADVCQSLTALCVDAPWNKEKVANSGGIKVLINAYRSQIGRTCPGAKELREKACETLATLAVERAHVSVLNRGGIMVDLIKNALEEGLASASSDQSRKIGGVAVPLVMRNLLSANCSSGDAAAKAATTSTVVKFVLQNYRNVEEAESALSMLQALTTVQDCVNVVARSNGALDKIVSAMEAFGDSASLQEWACGLLSNLYVHTGGRHRDESDILSLGLEVELIARALRNHPYRDGVEERACLALRNFCVVAPPAALGNDAVLPVLMSAVEEAVRVMSRNQQSPAVQENVAGFIWALSQISEGGCITVASSPDGVSSITDALQQHPDAETLQREALGAMEAISRISNTHPAMGTTGGIDAILTAIRKYDNKEDIVACGCALLSALSSANHQTKMNIIEHQLAIPHTISCMYQYPNSAIIQGSACSILAGVAVDNFIKEQIVNEGGINLVQGAMNKYASNEWVIEHACQALNNLISGAQNAILLGNNIIQKVISTVEAYPHSERMQEICMATLWNLSVKGPEFKHEIARQGGIKAVVNTMKTHIASGPVQEKGCVTLWSLAVSDANQIEIGRCGGIGAVVNGSSAHVGNLQLQNEAIGALRTMATNLENKERIRDCNGVKAIVSAMWVHYTNAELQEAAFSALTNIAVNPVTNAVSRMSANELDAVTSSMHRFPHVESLQQQACILLRNYTFAASNIQVMRENSMLFDLLQRAAENHPTACGERVMFIVDHLF